MNLYLEIEDTLSQLMVRKCGDCNLCCKLPNIHTPKNFKKDYTWCKHCEIGVGCKIYSDRPKMCKDFVCAWLLGLTPEELKPNKVGFYIIVETDKSFREKVFTVYADTHKVHNIHKYLKKFDYIDKDGDLWRYVIRYNSNENDLAIFDKAKFGNKLKFCKRGDY